MYVRELLSTLSKCGRLVTRAYHKSAILDDNAAPGGSIAVHTYGDFPNPHIHTIVPDGCFLEGGDFQMAPWLRTSEKNNYPILLVFRPDFGVALSGEYPDMPRSTRLEFGPNPGAILGYLFISEALTSNDLTEAFRY